MIKESFTQSRGTYGSRRVHRDLVEAKERVGIKRIGRLMRENGLRARMRKRFKHTTQSDPTLPAASNLLEQDFTAERPNQRWVADTTELLIDSGKIYLAVVMDLFSRFVVGWSLSKHNDRYLVMATTQAALMRRYPKGGLVFHSDRGSTYASHEHRHLLDQYGVVCSMSGTGNCFDNAPMESWFSTLKIELGEKFIDLEDAKRKVFDYSEVFYNQRRRHSTLGYVSPAAKERNYQDTVLAKAA
jgi:transposase InsO family protein